MKSVLVTTLNIEGFGSIDTVKRRRVKESLPALPLNDAPVISLLNLTFNRDISILGQFCVEVITYCL